jgi:D-alanyl-D-alanine carboxypeptidase/D-alanyl-D-alanine-endopeptidase (penicillin-binding protein 4)
VLVTQPDCLPGDYAGRKQLQVATLERRTAAGCSACHRANAGAEFEQIKGLDQVIVGAGLEHADPVGDKSAGSQHDDGCAFATCAPGAKELVARDTWQTKVQNITS